VIYKKNHSISLIVITCIIVFTIGAVIRYRTPNDLSKIKKKNIEGFAIITISNIIKAGFWKIDFKTGKPLMIAKNSMNVFKKGEKNQKRYTDPDISPGNKILAYTLEFNGKRSVGLMSTDGTNERPFLELEGDDIFCPSFSPDGKTLATISNDKIYITPYPALKDIELQSITQPEVAPRSLSWYENTLLGYITHGNIFKIVNIETAESKSIGKAKEASFSPDSKLLAVAYKNRLTIFNLSKTKEFFKKETPLNTFNIKTIGKLSWSPDSSYILTSIHKKRFTQKYKQTIIINVKNGEIFNLPKSWKASISHSWSKPE
jgi:WD40 repeat protein